MFIYSLRLDTQYPDVTLQRILTLKHVQARLNLFVVTKCLKHTLGYHDTDITIYMHQQTQKANMAKEVFV